MPIITVERYTRPEIRASRHSLYVFGDNLARAGGAPDASGWSNPRAGQAAACRNEPNAVGIPTKKLPSMKDGSFFSDDDFDAVKPIIQAEFVRLADHLRAGGTVVLPASGIGTERAQLAERAPRIRQFIDRCFAHLQTIHEESLADRPPVAGSAAPTSVVGTRRKLR